MQKTPLIENARSKLQQRGLPLTQGITPASLSGTAASERKRKRQMSLRRCVRTRNVELSFCITQRRGSIAPLNASEMSTESKTQSDQSRDITPVQNSARSWLATWQDQRFARETE